MHGLLWSARMQERLTDHLSDRRVFLLDLRGHGKSGKPHDPARYTWAALAGDVFGLLDHLGLERAVVGGLSLGANVALAAAVERPERMAGVVLEMPVLLRGHRVARPVFTAMAGVYGGAQAVLAPVGRAIGRIPAPRRLPEAAALRDMLSARPDVARAVLQGLLADEPVPEDDASLARITTPALVIGHHNDGLHVLDDARDLARRLPNARLVETPSILHYRLRPGELAAELRSFLAEVDRAAASSA
jgi:pimeloyl-ACP methyl ester carboxylesterase